MRRVEVSLVRNRLKRTIDAARERGREEQEGSDDVRLSHDGSFRQAVRIVTPDERIRLDVTQL